MASTSLHQADIVMAMLMWIVLKLRPTHMCNLTVIALPLACTFVVIGLPPPPRHLRCPPWNPTEWDEGLDGGLDALVEVLPEALDRLEHRSHAVLPLDRHQFVDLLGRFVGGVSRLGRCLASALRD